ncbi:DUF721 domain-containing protein [Paracoccaceae bacterium GXU_MW_L88]
MKTPYEKRRGTGGFRQTGGVLKGRLGKAVQQRGFAQTRLLSNWTEIAGDLAAKCTPVKLSQRAGSGGLLTLAVAGPDAPEVSMQLETLRGRINAALGYGSVSKIRLSQSAPVGMRGMAEAQAAFTPKPKIPAEPAAKASLAEMEDSPLREALTRLGKHVAAKGQTQEMKR